MAKLSLRPLAIFAIVYQFDGARSPETKIKPCVATVGNPSQSTPQKFVQGKENTMQRILHIDTIIIRTYTARAYTL